MFVGKTLQDVGTPRNFSIKQHLYNANGISKGSRCFYFNSVITQSNLPLYFVFFYNVYMKALIQRVKHAKVEVDNKTVGEINQGILAFIGVEQSDTTVNADKLLKKIISYRIFSDTDDKMNLSLNDIKGGLLLVSQFTLVANTQKGLRPSFSNAGSPDMSKELYQHMIEQAQNTQLTIQTGVFFRVN